MITRHDKESQKSIAQRVLNMAKEQESKKVLMAHRVDHCTIILVKVDKCIQNGTKCRKSKINGKI